MAGTTDRAIQSGLGALIAVAVMALWLSPAQAYPEPAAAPRAWQLEFTYGKPQPIAVDDLQGQTHWYWYLPYKVVNKTDQQRLFLPDVAIATDEGDIIPAGSAVPPRVFEAIRQRQGNPLLQTPVEIIGQLLPGEDQARESVIIWPEFTHDVGQITLFVQGLSGETAQVLNPLTQEPVLLRKTLMLRYGLPGKPPTPQLQEVLPIDTTWVMR